MSEIKYTVSVVVNGQHVVNVESDDPIITSKVVESLGQTFRVSPLARRADEPAPAPRPKQAISAPLFAVPAAQEPVCQIHGKPMAWVNRNGGFWSCHNRMNDGSWCKYKPNTQ
jgi:hypothetical protein